MDIQYFPVVITQDEDGVFIAKIPTLPGCHTYGKNLDELHKNLEEVIALWTKERQKEEETPLRFHSFEFFEFKPGLHA